MQQDSTNMENSYRKFIESVVDSDTVWGLTKDETWATSSSSEYEDTEVILFWSDKSGAAACAEDDWAAYTPESISLVEFLENWCVGMYGDSLLLGANWNADLTGKEEEPLVVALDVIQQLKQQNKNLEFSQYENQKDFEDQVVEALEGEDEE
jgi:hypothetical protein